MPQVIYVTSDNDVVERRTEKLKQPDRLMSRRPKGTKFIVRQCPRRSVWQVYDARTSIMNPRFGQFYSKPHMRIETPERDVAIGYCLLMG